MKNTKRAEFNPFAPTLKQLLIVTGIWLIGALLLVLVMTDLFTESPFHVEYTMLFFLLGTSTIAITFFNLNYLRVQKVQNKIKK